jgi:hypothetical protein
LPNRARKCNIHVHGRIGTPPKEWQIKAILLLLSLHGSCVSTKTKHPSKCIDTICTACAIFNWTRWASHYGHLWRGQRILAIWLVKSKSLSLSLHTKDQWPKDNAFQNAYMATPFMSFGAKNLACGQMFI